MSTLHDFDASDEPPPPAYEFTQQEFDQKISHALEQSRAAVDEEGGEWELWDEAAFAAAAAALTVSDNSTPAVAGASSSRSPPPPRPALASSSFPSSHNGDGRSNYSNEEGTATQPLRIVKKSREPSVKEKERPSWYADAGLDGHQRSASTSSRQRAPNSLHVANSLPNHSTEPVHLEEDREPTPPPMFEAVGPSLEGPPYEGYGEPQPQQPGLVMAYAPGDSRPASPLQSPTTSPTLTQVYVSSPPPLIQPLPGRRTLPVPPSRSPVPASLPREPREQQHLSVPQPPRPSGHRPNLRPTASYRDSLKSKSYVPPRVAFDPRIAYGEKDRSSYYDVPEESPPLDIDPASFYTASVSSIYSASTKRIRTSSIASSSLYSRPTAPQSTYSLPQTHSQYVAQPQAHYPINRESMRSPAPSVHSVASQSSQNHAQSYERPHTTYQQTYTAPAPSRASTYVPTAYQPTAYAPTSYQQQQQQQRRPQSSGYQQTAYQQQAVSNSYQTNGYLPTAY